MVVILFAHKHLYSAIITFIDYNECNYYERCEKCFLKKEKKIDLFLRREKVDWPRTW